MLPPRLVIPLLAAALVAPVMAQSLPRRQDDPIAPQVEAMYTKGLRFLASTQTAEGNWPDRTGSEPGVVGLCVMAFLAHGEDPNHGPFANNISKGLDYILRQQSDTNGYIGSSMYNHGFATLALAEAYGVLQDDRLAPALQSAVDLILSAQERNPRGAWRYTPESPDADTTVTGCQLVALFAARNAGIPIPDEALKKGQKFMIRCRGTDGSYGYTSAGSGKPTLTAIGCLTLALAKEKDSKGFASSLGYLKRRLNYRDRYYPYYFEYYMSQALFHAEDDAWTEWNSRNIRYLAALQSREGSWPGNKGPAFSTAGALLSLALNYRFLPIYEK
ncbi:MAG: terpene cyclase/mutase family protein [Akkermansiaceae bacterium]|nr:terpene cyclase/mutase family protein [Akkermansiaceae bacterium]NNM31196.1 terpene cyclase/mutase family protein [Akkermansiaceae bacterium]